MSQKLVLPLVGGRKAMKMKWLLDPERARLSWESGTGAASRTSLCRHLRQEAASPDIIWRGGLYKLFNVGS